MKRVLSVLLAVVMLFSFAACTGGSEDGASGTAGKHEFTTGYDETKYNAPGTLPVFKDKQTITVMMPDSIFIEDIDTNFQTLMTEEDLNADLVFTMLPSKEYSTKINLMAAAGGEEFTDAILGDFKDAMTMNLADAGVIADLTEYFYNTDISWNIQEVKDSLDWDIYPQITMPDGRIYAIPRVNESISNAGVAKMYVYKPWFEAAGIDIDEIHTTEDFKEALLTVVKSDPNGNGKADEVGITASASNKKWFHWLMSAFVYAPGHENYMTVEDGEITFSFQHEEWKDGLRYIKELYDLGLIDPLAFSQDSSSVTKLLNNPDTIVTGFVDLATGSISSDDVRRVTYEGMQPLNSSWNDGKPLALINAATADGKFVVSANAADKENAFRFGDYMMSLKVSIHNRYGEEGVDWLRPAEGEVSMYDSIGAEPYIKQVLAWSTKQNKHWCQTGPYILPRVVSEGIMRSDNPLDHTYTAAVAQIKYEGKYPDEYITKLIYTEDEREIVDEAIAQIKTYVDEMATKCITGELDIDGSWDEFQSQLETMGASEILECANAAYDRMQG